MKKISSIITLALISVAMPLLCVGCGDDKGGNGGGGDDKVVTTQTVVQFVSKLDDATIGTSNADFVKISDYFVNTLDKREGCGLAFIDRTDIVNTAAPNMFGGALKTALDSRHFTCFALNRIDGKTYQGTTVLLNRYMTDVWSYKLSDKSYVTGAGAMLNMESITDPTQKSNYGLNFWTTRLVDASGVEGLVNTISSIKTKTPNFAVIGTVEKGIAESLVSAVEASAAGKFKVLIHPDSENSDFNVFAIAENTNWLIEAGSVTDLSNGVKSYELILKR